MHTRRRLQTGTRGASEGRQAALGRGLQEQGRRRGQLVPGHTSHLRTTPLSKHVSHPTCPPAKERDHVQASDMPTVRQGDLGRLRPARRQRDVSGARIPALLVRARAQRWAHAAALGPVPPVSHRPRRGLEGDAGVVRVEQEVAPAAEADAQPPPPAGQRCGVVHRSRFGQVGPHAGNPSSTGSCPGPELVSARADAVRRDRGSRRRP